MNSRRLNDIAIRSGALSCAVSLALLAVLAPTDAAATLVDRRPLQLGGEVAISSAPGQTEDTWLYAPAFNAAYRILPGYSVGVGRLTFGSVPLAAGSRGHFGLTPYVEHYRFVRPSTQLFAQVGVGWQSRWGAGLPSATGIALMAAGGVRGWITPAVSVGAFMRATDVLSAAWAMSPRVLPSGAITLSLGFMLEAHL